MVGVSAPPPGTRCRPVAIPGDPTKPLLAKEVAALRDLRLHRSGLMLALVESACLRAE